MPFFRAFAKQCDIISPRQLWVSLYRNQGHADGFLSNDRSRRASTACKPRLAERTHTCASEAALLQAVERQQPGVLVGQHTQLRAWTPPVVSHGPSANKQRMACQEVHRCALSSKEAQPRPQLQQEQQRCLRVGLQQADHLPALAPRRPPRSCSTRLA